MLTGQTSMDYVNLHRADGAVLSCHVVVRSIPSGATAQGAMLRKNHSDERYAIISIRSASAMGNASFIGVGLLGVDRIPPAVMERAIDGAIAAQAQESPAVEALQLGNMEQFDDVEAEGLILD